MLLTLALSFAFASLTTAQTTTDSGLLAYTTSVGPCTTNTIPESDIVFSIQTDTVVETPGPQSACTYIVNADNPSQIVSTLTPASVIPTVSAPSTADVILISGSGSFTTSGSGAVVTETAVVSTTGGQEVTETATRTRTSAGAASRTSETAVPPASTTADGAAAGRGVAGEVFGVAGFVAMLAGFLM
ncbi:hypothetical protein TI39_contig365g00004 [Zymoseptoria brevis]|uniref:GPI anchored protein n=1 Tax=Zymoseptoria brevis TaxID=1047168 RepID=A0A0F4GPV0_9PEZI|nr:hypothetical protein TI39_contig365g00004 [Zymoseptoria brevis]